MYTDLLLSLSLELHEFREKKRLWFLVTTVDALEQVWVVWRVVVIVVVV